MRQSSPFSDIGSVIANPSRFFASPSSVLEARGLSHADRRRILESWVKDAELLAEAEAEGMSGGPGGSRPHLREAHQALMKLEEEEAARRGD